MTLHPGPSCPDAAPLARLYRLGSQEVTPDRTVAYACDHSFFYQYQVWMTLTFYLSSPSSFF